MSQEQLPPGWTENQFGELGSISGGSTPSTTTQEYWGGTIPWLTPSEVTKAKNLFLARTERYLTKEGLASCAAKLLPIGTVMMTSRATIGEVVINQIPMATNQGFINITCDKGKVYNEFLAYWIKHNKRLFEERAHGVTFKEITKSNFKAIPIPLPPLPEQRAIAHALRTVQEAREARRRELALERERKAALMQHLFTHGTKGEPTKETEIGEMPQSWQVVKLGEILLQTQYGLSQMGLSTGMYPILRMNNLVNGSINSKNLQYVELDEDMFRKFMLNKNDILFNRTNSYELVGKTSLFERGDNFVFASYLIRIVADTNRVLPAYLNFYLNWDTTQLRLKGKASRAVSQSNISASKLSSFTVPYPSSLSEQQKIVEVLQACDARIAALEKEERLLEELFQAMLEELMTGRLSALPLVEAEVTV